MNEQNFFFSIVIPLYNKEKYIQKTLESVLNQIYSNFEIIIVDDGSKDKSCEIVESINDTRIRLIRQENGGPSSARNRGIKEAKGRFIAFLDADDDWSTKKLEKQYELHTRNPDITWSCSGYKVLGGIKERVVSYVKEGVLEDAIDVIVDGMSIWTSTVVIRKDVFENERLLFNEEISRSEDIEVWYKLACSYPRIGYIQEQLAIYNVKIDGSLTGTAMDKEDFSTLSLATRLEKELNSIEHNRKEKLEKKIDQLIQGWIIGVWRDKKDFSKYNETFLPFIGIKLLNILNVTSFLPVSIKKIILKVIG